MIKNKIKVFYWADFETHYSKTLLNSLQKILPNYEFCLIENMEDILDPNFSLDIFDKGLLLCTDVTKFSSQREIVDKIGEKIENFVSSGKKLVVTHDIIYRRTRNTVLQRMFNYEILQFSRQNKVTYNRTLLCRESGMFKDLPDTFDIDDGELCWGDRFNSKEKIVFFKSKVEHPKDVKFIPVVFGKKSCDGQIMYLNTGDTFDNPPTPITSLDPNFMVLLKDSLEIDLDKVMENRNADVYLEKLHKCDFNKPFTFISYCSKNAEDVYKLVTIFDMCGLNYFLDKKNIVSGSWKDCAKTALENKNCTSAIIFASTDFLESEQCTYEIERFKEKKIKSVIFRLESNSEFLVDEISAMRFKGNISSAKLYEDLFSIEYDEHNNSKLTGMCYEYNTRFDCLYNQQVINSLETVCNLKLKINDKIILKVKEMTK